MRRFPVTPRKKSRVEIIPMIDVMMFLLVFFCADQHQCDPFAWSQVEAAAIESGCR
jgi:biopolymer transport protein ExbD